jgi:PAS domain S-box-containing protein
VSAAMFPTTWCYASVVFASVATVAVLLVLRKTLQAPKMTMALAVAAVLVSVAGTMLFSLQGRATVQRLETHRVFEILRTASRINAVVAHAESGQRGYILTSDPKYLASFTIAATRVGSEVASLKTLLAGDRDLADLGLQLTTAVDAKFQEMRSTLETIDASRRAEAMAIIHTDKGLNLTAAIEAICDTIQHRGQATLSALHDGQAHFESWIGFGTGGLLMVALFTIIGASLLSTRDTIERRRASRELDDRNDMFALAGEIANIGHWRLQLGASAGIFWSDEVFRIHGVEIGAGEPPLDQAIEYYLPDDRAKVKTTIEHAIATGEGFQFEARLQRTDGELADVICRGKSTRSKEGAVTSLYGVFVDVTAFRLSERSLERSERLYRLLAQNVTDIIVKYDTAYRMTFVSPSSMMLLGRDPAEMVGQSLGDLVHPDDRATLLERFSSWQPTIDAAQAGVEYRLRHQNGDWIWVEANACRIVDGEGGEDGSIAIIRDFRQRRQVQDSLEAAMESAEHARRQAESANRAKSDFLAAMSHEIRTPLNSIIGFTGLMLDSPRLVGDLRHQAEVVNSSGAALLTVISDILDFSKIEAGKIEIELVDFAPRGLVANALSIVRGTALSKNLDIDATIDPTLPDWLTGDQARIQQILLNLLNNAIKFTPSGSVGLTVRVDKVETDSVRLRFSIIDTGIGIAKAKQVRLFERFSQADASVSREFGGSGLGLAICKRLVDLMDGEIGVFSDAGRGANFWFTLTLPVAKHVVVDHAAESRPDVVAGRILLVEDVAVNQLLARTLLEAEGHCVDVVSCGEDAIDAVQARVYDIVLMDVQMPGMGGIAAMRAIRLLPRCSGLPIIAMTANVLSEQVRAFREAGMDDHIGKPINRADLRATIQRWIGADSTKGLEASVFDRSAFDAIADMLGEAKTLDTLKKFIIELETRFAPGDLAPGGRDAFGRDAHVVTSVAGMLGFTDITRSCADLVMMDASGPAVDGDAFSIKAHEILQDKERAIAKLLDLIAERDGCHVSVTAAA